MRTRVRDTPGRRIGARLFLAYALASLLPVVGLGALLVRAAHDAGATQGLAQGRAQAAVIAQMAIAPALDGERIGNRLSPSELVKLRRATDLAIYSGALTSLALRSFDGHVVFSDNGRRSQTVATDSAAFRAASRGQTDVGVIGSDPSTQVIRVLQSVVPNTTGEATGVVEIYLPYYPIAAAVHAETVKTYQRLGLGLVVLYLVLAAIAWSTTRRLRRHAARQTYHAAHDALTGLANRASFRRFATRAASDTVRGGALVLIDLNRFKEVNDMLGHHAGDELLHCVAQRLLDSVRTDDFVARLGGDEFGIVLTGVTDRDAIMVLLDDVHRRLGEAVEIAGRVMTIEGSFGVAIFPEDGTDVDQLLKDADAAMYQAKRSVRPTVIFEPGLAVPLSHSHEIHTELQRALDNDELVLHYQPKLDLRSGRIVGLEALARWQHPTRGLLSPGEFVPVVETSTLVGPFTEWAIDRALADLVQWRALGKPWKVAVNVSAHNLENPDFVDTVETQLHVHAARPDDLILELTETALASDSVALYANIKALSDLGVAVSIDDFGTGASGLLQLRGLAVDEIKLDRVFVRELAANAGDQNLARAVVQLAHGMNCTVVAEGVEDEDAAAYLRLVDCDLVQGFLYQRPVDWRDLIHGAPAVPAAGIAHVGDRTVVTQTAVARSDAGASDATSGSDVDSTMETVS